MAFKRLAWSLILCIIILYLANAIFFLKNGAEQPFNPEKHIEMWLFVFGWSMGIMGYWVVAVLIALFVGVIYWLIGRWGGTRRG